MLALLYTYLIAPRGFRRVLRWFAVLFFLAVLTMVVISFARILSTIPIHHGSLFYPHSHDPWSPDSIRLRHGVVHHAVKEVL